MTSLSKFRLIWLLALAIVLSWSLQPASAQSTPEMTAGEREAFEKLIEDYLLANPDVVVRAFRKYQEQQEAAEEAARTQRLSQLRSVLEQSETSPIGGNPNGDVVLVEFFDYRCGYCKRVHDTVVDTVSADGQVKLVYKEFPILGPESLYAAQAALGVHFSTPNKYSEFNDALMRARGTLSKDRVLQIAASIGLDPAQVDAGTRDVRVSRELDANRQLAQALRINGTPAFIIGNEIVPGALSQDALKDLIAKERQG